MTTGSQKLTFSGLLSSSLRFAALLILCGGGLRAANSSTEPETASATNRALSDALSSERWQEVEKTVDRALEWLASQQAADGSFPTLESGQPGVTSLAVMAYLSRGPQPGVGRHGELLDRAIDFVLSCQQADGLFSKGVPGETHDSFGPAHAASYNHAITGLMLGEVYGQVTGERAGKVKQAIEKGLQWTRRLQLVRIQQKPPEDRGGWRYLRISSRTDSDLSVTAWQLMFLRSAKNAEFEVPQEWVDEAMAYVRRCWNPGTGSFGYELRAGRSAADTRGMTGAGILSLSLGGQHRTSMAQAAGDWLLAHPYRRFGETIGSSDIFFYSTYYCSQAAAQLGGRHWEDIYPAIVNVLLQSQSANGSWPLELGLRGGVERFGQCYTTALAVLSLTPPYQLLPVYQR